MQGIRFSINYLAASLNAIFNAVPGTGDGLIRAIGKSTSKARRLVKRRCRLVFPRQVEANIRVRLHPLPYHIHVVQQPKAAKLARQRPQRVALRSLGLNGCPQGRGCSPWGCSAAAMEMTIWFDLPGGTPWSFVVVDEPQVLALGCGVGAFHVAIVHLHPLLANGNVRMVFSPPIISFKQPWC